jgi:hypothetical protein
VPCGRAVGRSLQAEQADTSEEAFGARSAGWRVWVDERSSEGADGVVTADQGEGGRYLVCLVDEHEALRDYAPAGFDIGSSCGYGRGCEVRSGGATKVDGSREVRSERRAARSVESVDGVALSSPEPAVRRSKQEGVVCQRARHGHAERLTEGKSLSRESHRERQDPQGDRMAVRAVSNAS